VPFEGAPARSSAYGVLVLYSAVDAVASAMKAIVPYLLIGTVLALPIHLHASSPFFFSLVGLFVISLVSNATPFLGASYTLVATTELIAFGFSVEAFILVVFVTAAGAAIGKLVIYGAAKGFKGWLSRNKNVQLLARWLQDRRFLVAVFVTAVIPILPLDDYIYIGAGAAKTRLAPMFTVTIAAKVVKSTFEIALELFGVIKITNFTTRFLGLSRLDVSLLLTAAFVVIGVFLFKFDWERILKRPAKGNQAPPNQT
jgi:hypothetical protein